jgi:hypothetical protein
VVTLCNKSEWLIWKIPGQPIKSVRNLEIEKRKICKNTVSQIWSFMVLFLTLTYLEPNSTPIVVSWSVLNLWSTNWSRRHDLPTSIWDLRVECEVGVEAYLSLRWWCIWTNRSRHSFMRGRVDQALMQKICRIIKRAQRADQRGNILFVKLIQILNSTKASANPALDKNIEKIRRKPNSSCSHGDHIRCWSFLNKYFTCWLCKEAIESV